MWGEKAWARKQTTGKKNYEPKLNDNIRGRKRRAMKDDFFKIQRKG